MLELAGSSRIAAIEAASKDNVALIYSDSKIQICRASCLFNPHALITKEHGNMIDDASKCFPLRDDIVVGGLNTWHVVDWDRRWVGSVTMDGEQGDDSLAIEHFSRYSQYLSPEIYRIHVSHTGENISKVKLDHPVAP
ncbi:hypothetical protein MKZ38_005602 [Zalerion maritima]|uniref:Uncharacterized protein n=1 Tax=Zalerion maritima TaxID=339359 RepID=A0AAD5WNW8_9PEZI|nr:hypothetical protein MKZ38_005602 [Zalerion maritima]